MDFDGGRHLGVEGTLLGLVGVPGRQTLPRSLNTTFAWHILRGSYAETGRDTVVLVRGELVSILPMHRPHPFLPGQDELLPSGAVAYNGVSYFHGHPTSGVPVHRSSSVGLCSRRGQTLLDILDYWLKEDGGRGLLQGGATIPGLLGEDLTHRESLLVDDGMAGGRPGGG